MKVALLTREFPPEVYGGAGVHVEHLATHLARLAHPGGASDAALTAPVEIGVHCFGRPRESPLVAAAYQPWPALAAHGAPGASALQTVSVDLLMAQGVASVDLVHSHTWYTNLAGHLAKSMFDVPHVMTTHSLEPLRPWKREQLGAGYGVSLFCERTAIENADGIIAVSEGMRRDILTTYPNVDPTRVSVIYNGVDTDEYFPDPGREALTAHGIEPDRPSVVFLGRITGQKGILDLFDAAHWFDPSAQLVVCAAAPDTPALRDAVASAVAALRAIRDGVIWIDEALSRPATVQVLSHATVFVCPSRYEPFGLVNVEAMACGAPVVASATGGIPEIVVDGETGWLVAPGMGFPKRLAERVNSLLRDPEAAAQFGRSGRQRVLERFAWPAIAAQTANLYHQVLDD